VCAGNARVSEDRIAALRGGERNVHIVIHRDDMDHPNAAELIASGTRRQRARYLHRIGGNVRAQGLELIDGVEHRNEDILDKGRRRFDKVTCAIR
jgi:hypothetical protein